MRNHAVPRTEGVLHRAPDVVAWRGLDVPDVTAIAVDLTRGERSGDRVFVTDGTTGGVDDPGTLYGKDVRNSQNDCRKI